MNNKMGKRGGAHLEMILAFTIFIVAVVFILVFIRPLESNKLSETVIITLKESFVEMTTTSLVTVFVNGTSERCMPKDYDLNWTYKNVSGSQTHYYAYFSDEFIERGTVCAPGSVNVGSETVRQVLSNNSLNELEKRYYENYNLLKEDLGLPQNLDFKIYSADFYLNMTKAVPQDIDIYSKKYTFSVLSSNGDLINKEMFFVVW